MLSAGNFTWSHVSWFAHNGTVYAPARLPGAAPPANLTFASVSGTVGEQWGSWGITSPAQPFDPVVQNVFRITLNHGVAPMLAPQTFAYSVLPTGSSAYNASQLVADVASRSVLTSTDSNSATLAWRNATTAALLSVLWNPAQAVASGAPSSPTQTWAISNATRTLALSVQASVPLADPATVAFSIADPNHFDGSASFVLSGFSLSAPSSAGAVRCTPLSASTVLVSFSLPSANFAGAPLFGACALHPVV
jgi:hypothetical protein